MLEDLFKLTTSEWFEEGDCFFQIAEPSLTGDVLTFSLDIDLCGAEDNQFWKIDCVGYLEHRVTLGHYYRIESHNDHVLLWPYTYPSALVSFFGESKDPLAVIGALYTEHVRSAGHWIPFDRFLNGEPHEMIAGRYGMLAQGPLPLIKIYSEVLDDFGVSNGISQLTPARFTNDSVTRMEEVSALIFDDHSYVIASKFNASRLE